MKSYFFVPSGIGIVAATVCFLMSLLFSVKCSYLNAQSLPFVFRFLVLVQSGWKGEGEQYVVLVSLLNWRIPFQNHNTSYCPNALGVYFKMLGRKT